MTGATCAVPPGFNQVDVAGTTAGVRVEADDGKDLFEPGVMQRRRRWKRGRSTAEVGAVTGNHSRHSMAGSPSSGVLRSRPLKGKRSLSRLANDD